MEQNSAKIERNTAQVPIPGDSKKGRINPRDDGNSGIVLPGLPNEIALHCLARIPPLLRSPLMAVSKAWQSHLRSQIPTPPDSNTSPGLPKNYVYVQVCSSNYQISVFAWNLQRKICLPLPPFPVHLRSAIFTVAGGRLFCVGTEVWAYNPSVNAWNSIPAPKVRRRRPAVGCIDGKIYVLGGCRPGSPDWAEVYDPAAGLWNSVLTSSETSITNEYCRDCVVVNGKLYGMSYGGLGFILDPARPALTILTRDSYKKTSAGRGHVSALFSSWDKLVNRRAALVKGILFGFFDGRLRGYDFRSNRWLVLQGMGNHVRRGLSSAFLANVEEKLCVIKKKGNKLNFTCLDIYYKHSAGALQCNVVWCHSVISSGAWTIHECVSVS